MKVFNIAFTVLLSAILLTNVVSCANVLDTSTSVRWKLFHICLFVRPSYMDDLDWCSENEPDIAKLIEDRVPAPPATPYHAPLTLDTRAYFRAFCYVFNDQTQLWDRMRDPATIIGGRQLSSDTVKCEASSLAGVSSE